MIAMPSMSNPLLRAALLLATASLAACSGNLADTLEEKFPGREAEYKASTSVPRLEVPPDLDSSTIQETLVVPGGSTTFSEYTGTSVQASATASTVLPEVQDVRVERSGDKRWLVIDAPPSQVWPRVRDFWQVNGFVIERADPAIGIMETDWAENRADIPQGFLRSLLENISENLYSAATRDRFRTRLERGVEPNTTEVYVTHRGAEEVSQRDTFVWQPRPADPELEAEMLSRMVIFLGVGEERARRMVASSADRPDRAQMLRDNEGATVLSVQEDFSRAWRRTGLALDRVGFTVEDRDRSRGLYFVRYVDPDKDLDNDKGFLSSLNIFGGDDERNPDEDAYLISLIAAPEATRIVVLNKQGERERTATADRILGLLHDQLR